MLQLLTDLVEHKIYANTKLLNAVREHPAAANDAGLRGTLHHILIANRYWLHLCLGRTFSADSEAAVPEKLDTIAQRYEDTHALEREWLSHVSDADLELVLVTPHHPGARFTVAEAMTQVCLHSQGHRAQCAMHLRALGGTPPSTDFILWVKDRRRLALLGVT